LFNDGSLTRVGEETNLNFWPDTRRLRLTQGTAAVFVPPNQGRTSIETPNAKVGLNSTGVVVRYVPSRELTLVMALANSPSGPVSITGGTMERETTLYAGQMAFVQGGTLQIVEFDLLEFYKTSDLIAGLQLDNPAYRPAVDEPLAALRPDLLLAISQQANFDRNDAILDPNLINDVATEQDLQTPAGDAGAPAYPTEELRRYNEAPAGVVSPLPGEATESPSVEPPSIDTPPVERQSAEPLNEP
jgi:acrosin